MIASSVAPDKRPMARGAESSSSSSKQPALNLNLQLQRVNKRPRGSLSSCSSSSTPDLSQELAADGQQLALEQTENDEIFANLFLAKPANELQLQFQWQSQSQSRLQPLACSSPAPPPAPAIARDVRRKRKSLHTRSISLLVNPDYCQHEAAKVTVAVAPPNSNNQPHGQLPTAPAQDARQIGFVLRQISDEFARHRRRLTI